MTNNDRFRQDFSEFGNTYELDTGVVCIDLRRTQ